MIFLIHALRTWKKWNLLTQIHITDTFITNCQVTLKNIILPSHRSFLIRTPSLGTGTKSSRSSWSGWSSQVVFNNFIFLRLLFTLLEKAAEKSVKSSQGRFLEMAMGKSIKSSRGSGDGKKCKKHPSSNWIEFSVIIIIHFFSYLLISILLLLLLLTESVKLILVLFYIRIKSNFACCLFLDLYLCIMHFIFTLYLLKAT